MAIPGIDIDINAVSVDGLPLRAAQARSILYRNAKMGMPLRYRVLDRRDAFATGLEYAHLEHDWNGYKAERTETISTKSQVPPGYQMTESPAENVPLAMRRPSAPERLTPLIISRFTGMLFSESRRPNVYVEGDEDADDFLRTVIRDSKFWRVAADARNIGGGIGSVLLTFKLRDGRFVFKAHNAKYVADWVWEDPDELVPAAVLIQYITIKEYDELDESGQPTGNVRQEPMVYRRIIDQQYDIVFKEKRLDPDGRPPAYMEIDEQQTYEHRLGKFPGVWIQNVYNSSDVDGLPDTDGAYQMIEEVDRLGAQINRGLKYNMDPTLWTSRDFRQWKGPGPGQDVVKGHGVGLELGPGGSAGYLEIAATGIQAARERRSELRQAVLDKTQCILADPDKVAAAATSGKALEIVYHPMLEKCDLLRGQYGPAFQHLFELVLEMARVWKTSAMYPGNARSVFKLPPKIEEHDPMPSNPDIKPKRIIKVRDPGVGGVVSLSWGPYFTPTPTDRNQETTSVTNAKLAGLLDLETAVKKIAAVFDIEDPEGLIRRIREEGSQDREPDELDDVIAGEVVDEDGEDLDRLANQLIAILEKLGKGEIERDSAVAAIEAIGQITREQALRIVGSTGKKKPAPQGPGAKPGPGVGPAGPPQIRTERGLDSDPGAGPGSGTGPDSTGVQTPSRPSDEDGGIP